MVMKQCKFDTDASVTSANETIGEEIGDFYTVFHYDFVRSAQSAETLRIP